MSGACFLGAHSMEGTHGSEHQSKENEKDVRARPWEETVYTLSSGSDMAVALMTHKKLLHRSALMVISIHKWRWGSRALLRGANGTWSYWEKESHCFQWYSHHWVVCGSLGSCTSMLIRITLGKPSGSYPVAHKAKQKQKDVKWGRNLMGGGGCCEDGESIGKGMQTNGTRIYYLLKVNNKGYENKNQSINTTVTRKFHEGSCHICMYKYIHICILYTYIYGKEGLWEKMSLKVKIQKKHPEKEKLATMVQSSHNGSKQNEDEWYHEKIREASQNGKRCILK